MQKKTDVRETPNDSTPAGGEGQGSRGETFHLIYSESPVSSVAESFYKAYCKSLALDILKTKCSYYDKLISNSNDRIKSSWKIVKVLTGRKSSCNTLPANNNFHR
jgi:hypothetical protein